ncbi:protoglobin family protein [Candidatus Sumerlaeota bacterium]|nr:protoglobin family protein [Candidatus Sumerlaeota bacterium]MBI3736044.1 protoglobin family protein [Candidatus Sumerlaeota bacterium]
MQRIDEPRLENDLGYRFRYLTDFMGFGDEDIAAIHAAAPLLAPVVPALVDAVYVKLFSYDATKRHFVPRQSGYDGTVPADLESLTLDHEQVKFRKNHLTNYLVKLVTAPYDNRMVAFLDMVGKIHTDQAGSPDIEVPLVQMDSLMGFVSDAILATILGLDLDSETRARTLRAFNKLLWLQNDLIVRHYARN